MINESEILGHAAILCEKARLAPPINIKRLDGGKNNRVFLVQLSDNSKVVLKSYFHSESDLRNRLMAEWTFINYALAKSVINVPKPLVCDHEGRFGLYSFVDGVKLRPEEINTREIEEALKFVISLNSAPRDLTNIPKGSEACFSVEEHINTIDIRVNKLQLIDNKVPLAQEVQDFVKSVVNPKWAAVKANLLNKAQAQNQKIGPSSICISPSDFGFHNALANKTGVTFIDFEYAGIDDPAKLASDLFCCPEIQIDERFHSDFVGGLVDGLGLNQDDKSRCLYILPAYKIKWTCIILNHFLATSYSRRQFSNSEINLDHFESQLNKAKMKMDSLN